MHWRSDNFRMTFVYLHLNQKMNKNISVFLRGRAEIQKYFRSFFGVAWRYTKVILKLDYLYLFQIIRFPYSFVSDFMYYFVSVSLVFMKIPPLLIWSISSIYICLCRGAYSFCSSYTVPLGDWLEKKKVPAIIIKQQFGFPMSTT